jgi:hypothetical protein
LFADLYNIASAYGKRGADAVLRGLEITAMLPFRRFAAPLVAGLLVALISALTARPASARLLIEIDKSSQRMVVSQDGVRIHVWPVSTGLRRYDTPSGAYTPFRLEKDHFSREWDDAPMPHSIFFTKQGHAIHGTDQLRAIGRPASHGCVRLERRNAATLFNLVKQEGMANVRIVLTGAVPVATDPAVARRAPATREQPRSIDPNAGRGFSGPSYSGRDYSERGYPDRAFAAPEPDVTGTIRAPRATRDEAREIPAAPRTGYWVQQPDGSRVFHDRERMMMPPPVPFFARPPGW